ncbi:MAG: hypothetical protein ABI990_12325 [Actinomycetota bacterium]
MDLEQAADELYGADLDEFVKLRTRLAKELRESGNGADADTLANLRKPSVAAWVLNQLARQHRRDIDLLLDAGHRLREAQAGVLSGSEKQTFDKARETERDALRRLSGEAEKLSASRSVINQVVESLRTASISTTGRELLARGRFTEPSRAEGFDIVRELAGNAPPRPRAATKRAVAEQAEREARAGLREAKERLRDAEGRERKAAQAADEARAAAEKESAAADGARRLVEEIEKTLAALRRKRG